MHSEYRALHYSASLGKSHSTETAPLCDHQALAYLVIIIIMTRRWLWSAVTALHDVHAPLHYATSVSSWLLFRRQSAVSVSFEDVQEVFASSYFLHVLTAG